jgi:hypothetical protein
MHQIMPKILVVYFIAEKMVNLVSGCFYHAKIENAQPPACLYYREGDITCWHAIWRQAWYGL